MSVLQVSTVKGEPVYLKTNVFLILTHFVKAWQPPYDRFSPQLHAVNPCA